MDIRRSKYGVRESNRSCAWGPKTFYMILPRTIKPALGRTENSPRDDPAYLISSERRLEELYAQFRALRETCLARNVEDMIGVRPV